MSSKLLAEISFDVKLTLPYLPYIRQKQKICMRTICRVKNPKMKQIWKTKSKSDTQLWRHHPLIWVKRVGLESTKLHVAETQENICTLILRWRFQKWSKFLKILKFGPPIVTSSSPNLGKKGSGLGSIKLDTAETNLRV